MLSPYCGQPLSSMRRRTFLALSGLMLAAPSLVAAQEDPIVVYIVRHAERADDGAAATDDPPLSAVSADPDFQPLENLLSESDIVTLHVPLVKHKPWPTARMADYTFFEQLKPGALFINAARGDICDYDALMDAKAGGAVSRTILDVWSPEPAFRPDVVKLADLASPHIAGHSYEGKLNGTVACYNELCNFFEIPKTWDVAASLPAPEVPTLGIDCRGKDDEDVLHEIIQQVYKIEDDDRLIREATAHSEVDRARNFDALRKNYRIRREFHNTEVTLNNAAHGLKQKVASMGFKVRQGS